MATDDTPNEGPVRTRKFQGDALPEEPRPGPLNATSMAVDWAVNPATRQVMLAPRSVIAGVRPIFLSWADLKIIAANVFSLEAQAEQKGLEFPRFVIENPQAAIGASPVAGYDGNGVRS